MTKQLHNFVFINIYLTFSPIRNRYELLHNSQTMLLNVKFKKKKILFERGIILRINFNSFGFYFQWYRKESLGFLYQVRNKSLDKEILLNPKQRPRSKKTFW